MKFLIVGLVCGLGLTAAPAAAQFELTVEAVAGRPFGVGRLTARLAPQIRLRPGQDSQVQLSEKDGRAVYPAVESAPVRVLLRDALGRPQQVEMYFLFRGDEPLSLTLHAGDALATQEAPVRRDARDHRRLLDDWWDAYLQAARRHARQNEYPAIIDNYLTATLSRRLGLELPNVSGGLFARRDIGDLDATLGLLTGAESVRAAMQKETLLQGVKDTEPANLPLPPAVSPPPLVIPQTPADVQVEPIAMHVPVECLYIRFGTFNNYQWCRSRLEVWGGDVRNLLALRGVDYGVNAKLEQQLMLHESALAGLLGPQVIEDVAIVGADTFFREGAATGMLFHAKNNLALSTDIRSQRARALAADKAITEKTVKIAGRDISFLSTPDNRVRSFYAVDGDFHFVTTSHTLAKRFFEAGAGDRSLGESQEFRYARSAMPLERGDTVFAYLSDEFFRTLVSPHYRIEMTRRLKASTDLELIQLAQLAARAEGQPSDTIDDLVAGDFLPRGFGARPDASWPVWENGQVFDSLRGGRGTFTPIPDVAFDLVSPSETEAYAEFARRYQLEWEQMDPVVLGIRREPISRGLERLLIEMHAAPFAKRHYSTLLRWLGPSTPLRVAPVPGDMIALQVVMSGNGLFGSGGPGRPYHLFGALRNFSPNFIVGENGVEFTGRQQDWLLGYFGSWPELGILSLLGRTEFIGDEAGYALLAGNLWQRRFDKFSVASFHRSVLEEVTPALAMVEDAIPAQVRLNVADLSQTPLGELADGYIFSQAKKISDGNLHFLASLSAQLGVPKEEALPVAETLLDAQLACPLAGQYKLLEEGGRVDWVSTATLEMAGNGGQPPKGYRAPPMQWFRGLDLNFGAQENTLSVFAELLVAPAGAGDVFSFPSLTPEKDRATEKEKKATPKPRAPEEQPPPRPERSE